MATKDPQDTTMEFGEGLFQGDPAKTDERSNVLSRARRYWSRTDRIMRARSRFLNGFCSNTAPRSRRP